MWTDRSIPSTTTDAHAAGWIVSLILHGTIAFGALLFLQHITLAPQQAPFQWNVALVAPAPQANVAPSSTAKQSPPPAPAAESTAQPVPTKVEPAVRPAEPLPPIVKKQMPDPATPQPIAEQIPHPIAEQPPLPKTTEMMDQIATHTEQTTPLTPPAPHASTSSTVQSPEPPPSLFRDSTQADQAPNASTLSTPSQPASSAPDESVLATQDEPEARQPQQVAALNRAGQSNSVKTDYGWLAELMAKWIGDLDKRYPAMLRTEGITGRVTLTALLHQNGTLTNVRVVKSSGNAQLDQVAVEDITKGPPVRLSRPLERPHMPVKFSIVYDLTTTH